MVNYLQKFSPNLSSVTAPLRDVKEVLSSPPVLKYFDPDQDFELQCDASEKCFGACVMLGGQPIAYASPSLTSTEQQYAQIEKEMLAIVYGTEF